MKKAFIFGGGELSKKETYLFDKLLVDSFHKKVVQVLFVPTASHDAQNYIETFCCVYSALGCNVDALRLCSVDNEPHLIKDKLNKADLIYVGGGDTLFMMTTWKDCGFDEYLKNAYENGKVLAGLSAGGISFCRYGYSDSLIMEGKGGFCFVAGLHLLDFDHNPHADELERKGFVAAYQTRDGKALSMDNLTLAYFEDGKLIKGYALDNQSKIKVIIAQAQHITETEIECIIL